MCKWRASPFLRGWKRIRCANCLLWHLLAFGRGRQKQNLSRRCVITGLFIWFFSYLASGWLILKWRVMRGRCWVTVWSEWRLFQSRFLGGLRICLLLLPGETLGQSALSSWDMPNRRRCWFSVVGIKYVSKIWLLVYFWMCLVWLLLLLVHTLLWCVLVAQARDHPNPSSPQGVSAAAKMFCTTHFTFRHLYSIGSTCVCFVVFLIGSYGTQGRCDFTKLSCERLSGKTRRQIVLPTTAPDVNGILQAYVSI